MSKQPNVPAPDEEQVIEGIAKRIIPGLTEYRKSKAYKKLFDNLDFKNFTALQLVEAVWKQLHSLGYRSPSEIRELERAAMERVFGEIERERFAEPQHIPQSGKEPVIICLTETDLEALKSELLEEK